MCCNIIYNLIYGFNILRQIDTILLYKKNKKIIINKVDKYFIFGENGPGTLHYIFKIKFAAWWLQKKHTHIT